MAQSGEGSLMLPDALRQLILSEARREESVEVLAAAGRCGERLASTLETLIGTAGARGMVRRTLTLTRREHAWLAEAFPDDHPPSLLAARLTAAETRTAAEAMSAAVALLTTLVQLLVLFIGERLTVQVLHQVWPEVASSVLTSKESP